MSGYLLDTHIWLWLIAKPEKLPEDFVEEIRSPSIKLFLSAASSWELAIKHALGKITLPADPSHFVPRHMSASGVSGLPVGHAHALRVAGLPHHHRDPFDRILVAQAQVEDLCLATADKAMEAYDVKLRTL